MCAELPQSEETKLLSLVERDNKLPSFKNGNSPKYTAAHYHAALYVQAAVRGFLARQEMLDALRKVGGISLMFVIRYVLVNHL